MPIFQGTSFQKIKEGYLQIVRYATTFVSVHLTAPLKLWQNVFRLSSGDNDKDDWKPVLLIVKLVIYVPQSNAALERFFNQLNYIKTNTRASQSSSSLNSLLHVKVTGPALQEYHNEYVEKVVKFWYNANNQIKQNKRKRKKYKQRSGTKNKRICFDIDALSLPDSGDSCSSSTSSSGDDMFSMINMFSQALMKTEIGVQF